MTVQVAGILEYVANPHQDFIVIGELQQILINIRRKIAGLIDLEKGNQRAVF